MLHERTRRRWLVRTLSERDRAGDEVMDQTTGARGGAGLPERHNDARIASLLEELHRTANPKLRQQIVELMRPLVRAVARKFSGREPLEDLESEGFVGLIRAVDRYSPSRGTRFSTFAVHLIAGQI